MTRGRRPAPYVGASLAVLAFYVVTYPLHGYRVGIGSDTPVYAWWARYAGAVGLGGLGTGPRAGVVGPLATLATVLHVSPADLAAVLGPVLAVSLALAAGAFVDANLGRGRVALTVLFTGTFLTLLVPGYLSTLGFGTAFVAALAALAVGVDGRDWWPIGAGAALLCAAGLSHVLFLVPGAIVLAGGLLALYRPSRQRVAGGERWTETPLGRAAAACAGGAALVVGALGLEGALGQVISTGSEGPITARDTLLRRSGLGGLVRDSYRRKLLHDFTWYRALVVVGSAFVPFAWPSPRRALDPSPDARPPSRWLFWGVVTAWLGLTVLGVIALLVGASSPGQRLAAFCLPLPMLAGVGVRAVARPGVTRGAFRALLAIAVVGYGAVAWMAWNKEGPLEPPAALAEARTAGAAVAARAPGTPLILVIDDYSDRPSLFVVRALNHVRAAVPGDRVGDVYAFIGTATDFLAGHPTLTGNREHDAMAATFWHDVSAVRTTRALAVSIRAFDPHRFGAVAALPGASALGPGVVALPGYDGGSCASPCRPDLVDAGAGPFSPWKPVWLAPALLAVLALVGVGWSLAVLRPRHGLAGALAPAFGMASVGLSALVVDSVGLRLDGVGGWVAFGLAFGGGVLAAGARGGLRPAPLGPGRAVTPAPPPPDPGPR